MAMTASNTNGQWRYWLLLWGFLVILPTSRGAKELEDLTRANELESKPQDFPLYSSAGNFVRQYPPVTAGGGGGGGFPSSGAGPALTPAGCPLCDASVYSYCSHKMLHDSCCCDYPVYQYRPPQCFYFDCALLYAKSCYEHLLIKNCCCNNPY